MVAQLVEDALTDAVLTRLDSPRLAELLAGKVSVDADVAALSQFCRLNSTPHDWMSWPRCTRVGPEDFR